jgi:hypothetical protein
MLGFVARPAQRLQVVYVVRAADTKRGHVVAFEVSRGRALSASVAVAEECAGALAAVFRIANGLAALARAEEVNIVLRLKLRSALHAIPHVADPLSL